jgi:hypothetical protein
MSLKCNLIRKKVRILTDAELEGFFDVFFFWLHFNFDLPENTHKSAHTNRNGTSFSRI